MNTCLITALIAVTNLALIGVVVWLGGTAVALKRKLDKTRNYGGRANCLCPECGGGVYDPIDVGRRYPKTACQLCGGDQWVPAEIAVDFLRRVVHTHFDPDAREGAGSETVLGGGDA